MIFFGLLLAWRYTKKKSYLFNEKADIYSFGIVLLEVITGQPVFSKTTEAIHIKKWVDSMLPKVVDPRLDETFNINSVRKDVKIAIECELQIPAKGQPWVRR